MNDGVLLSIVEFISNYLLPITIDKEIDRTSRNHTGESRP